MNPNIEQMTAEIVAKEQMLAIVFHDIKNPLAAIQLEAQMLLRSAERAGSSLLAEEVKIQARRILKTTERMKILISDLLKENQSENGLTKLKKEICPIREILQEVLDSIKPLSIDKNISLIFPVNLNTLVSVDKNKFIQVLSNLYNNAIQFTPRNGSIEFSIEENDFEYVFSIEDSGNGLDNHLFKNIFDKYWSSNSPEGTGLGLYICKSIIEAHAGHIFVENGTKLGGARFKFTIPKNIGQGKDRRFSFYQ